MPSNTVEPVYWEIKDVAKWSQVDREHTCRSTENRVRDPVVRTLDHYGLLELTYSEGQIQTGRGQVGRKARQD